MADDERDIRQTKAAYDLATLFRVLPWILLMGDQRGPQALVRAALDESRRFLESYVDDPTRDRRALMRGLSMTWFQTIGVQVNPDVLEAVIGLVAQQVDALIDEQFSSGLDGETV